MGTLTLCRKPLKSAGLECHTSNKTSKFLKFPKVWVCVCVCVCVSCSVVSDSLWTHGLWLARVLCPWNSPGKNTGVGCCSLLQGIFPTQRLNPGLLHCRQLLYHLRHQGSSFCDHWSLINSIHLSSFSASAYREPNVTSHFLVLLKNSSESCFRPSPGFWAGECPEGQ